MSWNEKPWVKGGIWGAIIVIGLVFIYYLYWGVFICDEGATSVMAGGCSFFTIFGTLGSLVLGIPGFLIGALIGYIMGKIKSNKKKK